MSPKAADRFVSEVGRRDVDAFRRALVLMADLELESRGGGGDRVVGEDTAAVRAVIAAAGGGAQASQACMVVCAAISPSRSSSVAEQCTRTPSA